MSSKRKIHSVNLQFFQDDQTGDYGLAHAETFNSNEPFNAFFNGIGIFHDVFEHWFELRHPYFKGDAFCNRGGECAAMGAAMYYYNALGVYNRPLSNYTPFEEAVRLENQYAITEYIENGYGSFGDTLECRVPYQKPTYNNELEYCIKELWNNVKDVRFTGDNEDDKETSKNYKKSVTFQKLANLYRWGYRMAERLVPDNRTNVNTCCDFIDFFNTWCENNNAHELSNDFRSLRIDIYKEGKEITWKATLISSNYEIPDIKIKTPNTIDIYDYMTFED